MDQAIIFCAKYLFIVIPLLLIIVWLQANKKQRKELILAVIIGVIIAVILDKIGGKLFYDTRPFVSQNIQPLVSHSADNGFPSEHALFSSLIATIIIFYRRQLGIIALVIAIVVGFARVLAHVHSPIDIIGGLAIGIGAGVAGVYLARRILQDKLKKD